MGTIIIFIVVIVITRAFQCQLLDAILVEVDSVIQDLVFEQKDVELISVGLGEEEFVRNTRIGLFDGNIWRGNGLRSVRKFLYFVSVPSLLYFFRNAHLFLMGIRLSGGSVSFHV